MRRPWGTALVFAVATILLVSMGGAIIAAPVTLPLMYLGVRRHPTRLFTVVGTLLGALTGAEVVWAAAYLALGEPKPWIWLLPTIGALATLVAFGRLGSGDCRRRLRGRWQRLR